MNARPLSRSPWRRHAVSFLRRVPPKKQVQRIPKTPSPTFPLLERHRLELVAEEMTGDCLSSAWKSNHVAKTGIKRW